MLAVFSVDVANLTPSSETEKIALAINRLAVNLLSVDPRLEVAVDLWSSVAARHSLGRVSFDHPTRNWADSLQSKLKNAVYEYSNSTNKKSGPVCRLDALKSHLRLLSANLPWTESNTWHTHLAQSPLTLKHKSHPIHTKSVPNRLAGTSDRVNVLKGLKNMPPSAVRHHLFLFSEIPTDANEWIGPNPSKLADQGAKKLFDALLGKDGLAWADWTDRRVAVSWVSVPTTGSATTGATSSVNANTLNVGPVISCLGGNFVPLPHLCLPDSWIPFDSVFGPLRPKRIDREIGRLAVISGKPEIPDRTDSLSLESEGTCWTIEGRRIGNWDAESLQLCNDPIEPHEPACFAFLVRELPDGFPANASFACPEATFRLVSHGQLHLLLPFEPPVAPETAELLSESVERLAGLAGKTLHLPTHGKTGLTSPLRQTKMTPLPSPARPRHSSSDAVMEPIDEGMEETTMVRPKTAEEVVALWGDWVARVIEEPVSLYTLSVTQGVDIWILV